MDLFTYLFWLTVKAEIRVVGKLLRNCKIFWHRMGWVSNFTNFGHFFSIIFVNIGIKMRLRFRKSEKLIRGHPQMISRSRGAGGLAERDISWQGDEDWSIVTSHLIFLSEYIIIKPEIWILNISTTRLYCTDQSHRQFSPFFF